MIHLAIWLVSSYIVVAFAVMLILVPFIALGNAMAQGRANARAHRAWKRNRNARLRQERAKELARIHKIRAARRAQRQLERARYKAALVAGRLMEEHIKAHGWA